MERGSQKPKIEIDDMESLPRKPYEKDNRSKLPKRTVAKLGSTALDLKNFLHGTQDYYDEEEAHQEYIASREIVVNRSNYPDYYLDWQVECCELIKDKPNVILSAPTGSGKTSVFMRWAMEKQKQAEKQGESHHKVYITAPIKALSNQRFRELQETGIKVGLETGDIKNVPEDAEYICCTQEIYTNKYAKDKNNTLIVDEFHYAFENPERQRAYIDGVHNAQAENILICSATMGDMQKTTGYINKISDREFTSYETHDRLTELTYGGKIDPSQIENALVVAFSSNKILGINKRLCKEREFYRKEELDDLSDEEKEKAQNELKEKANRIKEIAKKYQVSPQPSMIYGVANYYSRMLPKEKLYVEELFEKSLIDTVVGTDALAMGVNFPIENVVFTQLMKYQGKDKGAERLSKNLFDQLCGRAGRKGYFDQGHVYYATDFVDINGYPTEERYKKWTDEDEDWWEWTNYDTGAIFDDLINAENEDLSIALSGDTRALLSGKRSVEDEAKYIIDFSTKYSQDDYKKIREQLEERLNYVHDYQVDADHPEYNNEFLEGIAEVYDETIPTSGDYYLTEVSKNCRLFAKIILDGHSDDYGSKKLSTRDLFQLYAEHADNFNELLQFRKYMRSLPSKYRKMYDLAGLDDIIDRIDYTVLNAQSDKLRASDIAIEKSRYSDPELLIEVFGFDEVKDEVFEAIEKGDVPAEKIFSGLSAFKQWEYAEIFKRELNCNIDINSVIEEMYDEAWEEARERIRYQMDPVNSVDNLVRSNLIKIFKLGGDITIGRQGGGWYDDDEIESNTIENAVTYADKEEFLRELSYIVNDHPDISKDVMSSKIESLSGCPLSAFIYDDKIWNYVTEDLAINKEQLLDNSSIREDKEDVAGIIARLLDKGVDKGNILSLINNNSDLRRQLTDVGPIFNSLVGLGFSAEELYKEYISSSWGLKNTFGDAEFSNLMSCGISAQRILSDIDDFDHLLACSECLESGGGGVSARLMELIQNVNVVEYVDSDRLKMRLEKGTKYGLEPNYIASFINTEDRIRNIDILKEYNVDIDINTEIDNASPWALYHIGIDHLLENGADPERIKGIVKEEETYAITNGGGGTWESYTVKRTGRQWKEMVDEAVNRRKEHNES